MYNLDKLTFITPLRIDTESRGENLQIFYKFYKETTENCNFIFVENDIESKALKYIKLQKNDYYIFYPNYIPENLFEKCKSFNIGSKIYINNFYGFIDVDIIINPKQIKDGLDFLKNNNESIILPYNGQAFYVNNNCKKDFAKDNNYINLYKKLPKIRKTNYIDENLLIGNVNAIGGCIMMSNKTFLKLNGFNPNFLHWGYEDSEIISRSRRLRISIFKLKEENDVLWHMYHDDLKPKEQHSHYKRNHQIISMVESYNKEQLEEYIKTWKI